MSVNSDNTSSNATPAAEAPLRVLIAGIDGYLGWPLAQHLAARGHVVAGIDNLLRRRMVAEMGSISAIPILDIEERADGFAERFGYRPHIVVGDLGDESTTVDLLEKFKPQAVVHLAEIPSAPYSMIDAQHAVFTHQNNLSGTLHLLYAMRDICPEAHLLKLGTLGEYGTPNVDIPEGYFDLEWKGRTARLPFPRQPGSMYHLTKVHDSAIVDFASRIWGLRSTDVMQGVVFGTRMESMTPDPTMATRFDFDEAFGTAINRFCAQAAAGLPITPYGKGSQTRGFLPITDSIQCFTLALENPPKAGECRVFNQFAQYHTIGELAAVVADQARELGLEGKIVPVENPRREMEEHYYNPEHQGLFDLGYKPQGNLKGAIRQALTDLLPHKDRIAEHRDSSAASIRWEGGRRESRAISELGEVVDLADRLKAASSK